MEHLLEIIKYDPTQGFVFTHYLFWIFFGVVLIGNAILYKKSVWRNCFLFLVSLFFYYKAGGYYFTLLIFSTLVDYHIALAIANCGLKRNRKILLVISIVINLSLLGYFKYSYFVLNVIEGITGHEVTIKNYFAIFFNKIFRADLSVDRILLPVGISFFTFQTISYSVDVYRNRILPVKNIIDFGFYVSFFPQLVAGPIVRAWEFIPQLYQKSQISSKWFWWAVALILGGLFKKVVISDYLALNMVDRVFDSPLMYSGVELLMGAYAYTLQIYCDFSGYTDIAIGLALMLGFRLPENFNRPYSSTSVTSFWRRWHISLSSWLRDYLYIPLGGNRRGQLRQGVNLMITMLLGGLWHGAGWLFVLWGGLHGLALLIEKQFFRMKIKIPKYIGFLLTFHFVVFTWIVFRSPDLETMGLFFLRIKNAFVVFSLNEMIHNYANVLILIFVGYMLHWLPKELIRTIRYYYFKTPVFLKLAIIVLFCLFIYQFSLSDAKPFIYFRF